MAISSQNHQKMGRFGFRLQDQWRVHNPTALVKGALLQHQTWESNRGVRLKDERNYELEIGRKHQQFCGEKVFPVYLSPSTMRLRSRGLAEVIKIDKPRDLTVPEFWTKRDTWISSFNQV